MILWIITLIFIVWGQYEQAKLLWGLLRIHLQSNDWINTPLIRKLLFLILLLLYSKCKTRKNNNSDCIPCVSDVEFEIGVGSFSNRGILCVDHWRLVWWEYPEDIRNILKRRTCASVNVRLGIKKGKSHNLIWSLMTFSRNYANYFFFNSSCPPAAK